MWRKTAVALRVTGGRVGATWHRYSCFEKITEERLEIARFKEKELPTFGTDCFDKNANSLNLTYYSLLQLLR